MDLPFFLKSLLILVFVVISGRIIEVSLIKGSYFETLARTNRVRKIPIFAPRGGVFDRNMVSLAKNETAAKIASFEEGKAVSFKDQPSPLNEDDVAVPVYKRVYPEGELGAHVVGFLGEADREEVEKKGCPDNIFNLGDNVGRLGAELAFDCLLRGKNGEELVEVDTKGRKVRVLGRKEGISGTDLVLSIDQKLERRAAAAFAGKRGAIVAIAPQTGEVLALVSSPSFDLNKISQDYRKLVENPDKPLFNRAIGGAYPPGSTFKIAAAAAALEEGVIDENFRFTDPGVMKLGAEEFTNWLFTKRGATEGEIDIVRAIVRSTDTFFYKLGEMVGEDKLAFWAKKFGLGARTEIEISGETSGLVPNSDWKERVKGERWFLGNTYNMSIGQGDVTASPLQIAMMTSVIANNGSLCKPTVLRVGSEKGKVGNCDNIGLSQKTLDIIRRGMAGACSQGGTAWPLFDFKVKDPHLPNDAPAREIQVACKTGTAEFGHPEHKTHAWLTAYAPAPADNPEIVVTALVEEGGEGSDVAAPIVREVLEEWFANR